jgi:pimeloyl-ACP methyl ester carboxylesterase
MILHAIEAGAGAGAGGTPVALLHGLFGQARNFGALQRRLAARRRVLALDLRNHGESPHAPGMDYPVLAEDVHETLAGRGAVPADLLGHSMGGKTAMALALLHPRAVRRLIVADIAPVAYAHHNAAVAAALRALPLRPGLSRAEADRHLATAVPDPRVRAFLLTNLLTGPDPRSEPRWRIGLDEIAAGMDRIEGWPESWPNPCFDGPALFLYGGASDYVRPEHRPAILRLFPRASFQDIPGAGHWLHADAPEAFAHAVEAFLDAA